MFNIFICKGLYHTDTGKCVLETCIDIPDLTSVFHKSCLHPGILLKGKPKHNNNKDDQWKCQFLIDKEKEDKSTDDLYQRDKKVFRTMVCKLGNIKKVTDQFAHHLTGIILTVIGK